MRTIFCRFSIGCRVILSWKRSILPFVRVTKGLNQRIIDCFAHELEIDIVLYLGLCNAAGWVTNINGRDVILLGIEKILELSWYDEDSMYGLIYHELGTSTISNTAHLSRRAEIKAKTYLAAVHRGDCDVL